MEVEYSEAPKDRRPDGLGDLCILPDETICLILTNLTPHDVGRLSCVSSVLYILCNEEPLWMSLCLNSSDGQLQYRDSWKKTAMDRLHLSYECKSAKPIHFDGFYSLFLLRRHYRCHTTLSGFNFDNGNVDRRRDISLEDFQQEFDGKKPVLLSGLADDWPACRTWTIDQLMLNYGDTSFRISQKSARKISMKFKDYVSYMQIQHDEDPLYIFDEKFGEVTPKLLEDYNVPYLFQEDYFDVLDREKRPPFRWFLSGPERSGASWHVDPALTSAWNTLICGRKRWALYPPGRVPLGVTVHVNEEDGDVNIESPSSLQWWLDFYPLLPDEDKPIECTQLPGETIFVPSGWWHCVLNLENTVAVTQNFVNSTNFQFVCLDMAPGYQHKGVCRAGLLALDEGNSDDTGYITPSTDDSLVESDIVRKDKRIKLCEAVEEQEFSYDINFLEQFLDKGKDHYSSPWSESNNMGPREMREWLSKLWVGKPGLRDLIWKGACLALNAGKWFDCIREICAIHQLPLPTDDERLPVGTGSNPVYLFADNVVKLYVEDGLEACLHALGSELEFYSLLCKVDSPLKNHIPDVLATGIIFIENGSYKILPWDGKGVPDVVASLNLVPENRLKAEFPFGVWGKMLFEFGAVTTVNQPLTSKECSRIWPYIITKRCTGKIFAELRDTLSWQDNLNIASFLGEQVRNLHLLPFPSLNESAFSNNEEKPDYLVSSLGLLNGFHIPKEWGFFIRTLNRMKKDVCSRLTKWGDPIPSFLIDQVNEYIPDDFFKFLNIVQNGEVGEGKTCSWIHSDIMDDNIHMELCPAEHISFDNQTQTSCANGDHSDAEKTSWKTTHILDFSDLSLGDPICDLIPIHLDIFRGDPMLLKQFLESYKLPLGRKTPRHNAIENGDKFGRLSYITMCYCILHKENILGAIFSIWSELRTAKSWEVVEEAVWGDLNHYSGFS